MGDPLLHQNATVMCVHLPGKAEPVTPNPSVKVSNQATVTQSALYRITGCSNPVPPGPKCLTASFITAAKRVRSNGVPLLLKTSEAKCAPTLTGLNVILTQVRVKAI
jgi:hypothetical protein